jgi:hypothetical protein
MQQLRTPQQNEIDNALVERFNIDGSEVLFLDEKKPTKPWLRARTLASIARSSGKFKVVRSEFEQYIEPLKQIVYQGTLVDLDDRIFSLPGVATINEAIRIDDTDEVVDAHDLAESKSLRSTFVLAGFDPFDSNSAVPLGEFKPQRTQDPAAAEAESRRADLAAIHILAKEKNLISFAGDATKYRDFLAQHFEGTRTAAGFDAVGRKSLIEALRHYVPPPPVVDEFAELEGATA